MGQSGLTWSVDRSGAKPVVFIQGVVDENAPFEDLAAQIDTGCDFDLSGVSRINTCGVREWITFIESLGGKGTHRLVRCSPTIVLQLNMIYNFRGPASVASVMAPFLCEDCDVEAHAEVPVIDKSVKVPELPCKICGAPMDFDEIEAHYFLFLKYP